MYFISGKVFANRTVESGVPPKVVRLFRKNVSLIRVSFAFLPVAQNFGGI